ncbi:MAG: hypothetical protein BWY98_00689 [Tenericutes bacterium ADurb.BinA155]|nr:MAG: hypothetical protein BWY98_00689 [Tenericutes bacterium ADurb.BinA155]
MFFIEAMKQDEIDNGESKANIEKDAMGDIEIEGKRKIFGASPKEILNRIGLKIANDEEEEANVDRVTFFRVRFETMVKPPIVKAIGKHQSDFDPHEEGAILEAEVRHIPHHPHREIGEEGGHRKDGGRHHEFADIDQHLGRMELANADHDDGSDP